MTEYFRLLGYHTFETSGLMVATGRTHLPVMRTWTGGLGGVCYTHYKHVRDSRRLHYPEHHSYKYKCSHEVRDVEADNE